MESTIKTLSFFLPGKFQNADVVSQAICTCVNILKLKEQEIIMDNRNYSKFRVIVTLFSLLQHTEILAEMIMGENVVIPIEFSKSLLRLLLFIRSEFKLTSDSLYVELVEKTEGKFKLESSKDKILQVLLSRNIPSNSLINNFSSNLEYLTFISEIIYIFRPLIYASLLRIYGKRSFIPWIFSLSFEVTSHSLRQKRTFADKKEHRYRLFLFILYVIKSPVYQLAVKEHLKGFCDVGGRIPIISWFTSNFVFKFRCFERISCFVGKILFLYFVALFSLIK